jgi:hypothetical protein
LSRSGGQKYALFHFYRALDIGARRGRIWG